MTKSNTRWVIALSALMGILGTAQGQTRRYARFKIDPDYEKVLAGRLELASFKDLVKRVLADPSKLPVDMKQLEQFNLEKNEKFKQALKNWVEDDPQLKQALTDWAKQKAADKQPDKVKKFRQDVNDVLKDLPKDERPPENVAPNVGRELQDDAPDAGEPESLAAMAERAMKQLGDTKFGDWLGKSPAWNRAFSDLQTSVNNPGATRWRDWQGRLSMPEGSWKFGQAAVDRLKDLPRPDVESWRLPGLGSVSMPSVGAPVLPDLNRLSLGAGASWILFLLVLLFVGWHLMRWSRQPTAGDTRALLGPWPVRPEAVATRAELILAFDYLALWSLGLAVKSWNHRAVAGRWREQAPSLAALARVLESLYEEARYTEGIEALSEVEREEARHSLRKLAEAF
ncbi:MAG: hypothetical protein EXR98_21485 [Gemmataceae bacterium]|nr:hypothetical protein [Gemmataceae bacterium]